MFYDTAGLLFFEKFTFRQVFWKLWATAVFKDEWDLIIDGDFVYKFGDVGVIEAFKGVDFSLDMFYELLSILDIFSWLKTVGLDSDIISLFQVIAFVHFSKSATSKQLQRQISAVDKWPVSFGHGAIRLLISQS